MVKQWKSLLLALFFIPFPLFAVERAGIDIAIRLVDKRIYYLEDAPILVQVTLTNSGTSTYRFKLADERMFSIDFEVRTITNRTVEPADALVRRRTAMRQVFFREVAVESGESFSFVEDLRNYAAFRQSGSYIVQARIYPELYRDASPYLLESNRLNLSIRPPAIPDPSGLPLPMDEATNALLVRERLPPDEVVRYILTARQRSQWEKFFLYLDLEAMIIRDGPRSRQWLAASEEERRRMLARYRTELETAAADGDIATIPSEFEIERTNYGPEEGTVVVLEKFRTSGGYTERKRYTYYLRRKDDIWTIVDYVVIHLGTE
jgi:hypothetical protein